MAPPPPGACGRGWRPAGIVQGIVAHPEHVYHLVRAALANTSLYVSAAARVRARARRARRVPEERLLFVVGSPRSGTTFLARALGAHPGVVDLDELKPWKAAIPALVSSPDGEATTRAREIIERVRRLAGAQFLRGVEQTPETSFVLGAVLEAYPEATAVHIVRDGRDVVCSLLERGWLSADHHGRDDVHAPYGPEPRFWVEPQRREEFRRVSDAARAAWAWRRYVSAARAAPERTVEIRYEALAADPEGTAAAVAPLLEMTPAALAAAFAEATTSSVGRWRRDLSPEQLADVEREAGPLLRELGYADGRPS